MIGIKDIGIYIPRYRLSNGKLQKSVCNFDEDSITMAIESVMGMDIDCENIGSLYYSTCSPIYNEKQESATIASVLNIDKGCKTIDISKSLRGAIDALVNAYNEINAGKVEECLVTSADDRIVEPENALEYKIGAGAASVLIAKNEDLIAEILNYETSYDEVLNVWRYSNQMDLNFGDNRYLNKYDYTKNIVNCINKLVESHQIDLSDIKKIMIPVFDFKVGVDIAKELNVNGKKIKRLKTDFGYCGTPQPFIEFFLELENLQVGDEVILIGFGDGCTALHLKIKSIPLDKIEKFKDRIQDIEEMDYIKYLKFKKVITKRNIEMIDPYTSPIVLHREGSMNQSLVIQKCKTCGTHHYPHRKICWKCKDKMNFELVMPQKTGKVFTFTEGYLYPTLEDVTTMAIIDLDSGGRLAMMMTELKAQELKIGDTVKLVYRILYDNKGYRNYYWKAKRGVI